MSRNTSDELQRAVNAQETDEVFLVLLTINHATMDQPLRVVNNWVNITSRGNEYLATAFQLVLPQERDNEPPQAQLSIDNVDREIVRIIRSLDSPPSVTAEVVLASAPDNVEASFQDMVFSNISYDKLTVKGTLSFENILDEPYPGDKFQPAGFPALFAH